MLKIIAIAIFCVISNFASAAVFYQDVFLDGVPGTGGSVTTSFCSATSCAQGGYQTPFHVYNPGDVVNFGTVTLSSSSFCDFRNGGCNFFRPNLVVSYQNVPLGSGPFGLLSEIGGCNVYTSPGCSSSFPFQSTVFDLTFTIPEGATGIELGWSSFASYAAPQILVAPVPEASTWAMLLIGFAGIGFAAHRRKRLVPSTTGLRASQLAGAGVS